jgi:ABC-type phosphate/phosphonate transport system permease subunit
VSFSFIKSILSFPFTCIATKNVSNNKTMKQLLKMFVTFVQQCF